MAESVCVCVAEQMQMSVANALLQANQVLEAVKWAKSASLVGAPSADKLPYANFENPRQFRPCDLQVFHHLTDCERVFARECRRAQSGNVAVDRLTRGFCRHSLMQQQRRRTRSRRCCLQSCRCGGSHRGSICR